MIFSESPASQLDVARKGKVHAVNTINQLAAAGSADQQVYFNEGWVAKRLGLSKKTIQSWRDKGDGPPYRKFGSAVRYALSDIEAYEVDALRTSTSDLGPGGRNA